MGSPAIEVKKAYVQGLEDFSKSVSTLFEISGELHRSGDDPSKLRDALRQARIDFKKIEFLIEYLQPQDVKDYINGAPLPKVERNAPALHVIEPSGLQTLDELVYSEEVLLHTGDIKKLTRKLNFQVKQITSFQKAAKLTDRQVFEAIRSELVRIMSMGLTGFDIPSGNSGLIENVTTWKSLMTAMEPYLETARADHAALAHSIEQNFSKGLEFLLNEDSFDDLDRLTFIREFINPLYGDIGKLHKAIGFEMPSEVYERELAWNYRSQEIFSDDFLNPFFYTVLYEEMDKPEMRRLGQRLFFDPILSGDNKRSCGSCHDPRLAFSDGVPRSPDMTGNGTVKRNAPGLVNAIYAERFFYDLRADKIDNQVEHVIFSDKEFNTSYDAIFSELDANADYVRLFGAAFPEREGKIDKYSLSSALASYVMSLRSFNSPMDRYLRGESETLEPKAKDGFNLFMGKAACGTCHFAPTFSGLVPPLFEENETEILGVLTGPESGEVDSDRGRFASGRPEDRTEIFNRSFKTTTVRNAEVTGPYFHNGAFKTLEEVVDFYDHGGGAGAGLDVPYQTLPPDSLGLNAYEKQALVAFIKSLTDYENLLPTASENDQ